MDMKEFIDPELEFIEVNLSERVTAESLPSNSGEVELVDDLTF